MMNSGKNLQVSFSAELPIVSSCFIHGIPCLDAGDGVRLRKVWSRYDQDGNQVLSVRSPEAVTRPLGLSIAMGPHGWMVSVRENPHLKFR